MKKVFLFVVVAGVFTLASCTKDRTCTCTDANGDKTVTVIKKVTKDDMRANGCVTTTTTSTPNGGSAGTAVTNTCTFN
jgi:hypothetical protein